MITTAISNNSIVTTNGVKSILSKVNYTRLSCGLYLKKKYPEQSRTIVLFEYVNSPSDAQIAEVERIPETTKSFHNFLLENSDLLYSLFASTSRMVVYTRRKFENNTPTKYRQVVLYIPAEPLSPIVNPEDEDLKDYYF